MKRIAARRSPATTGVAAPRRDRIAVAAREDVAQLARLRASGPVPPRALEIEALLHLPRLAAADGTVETKRADAEIERLNRRLRGLYLPALSLMRAPSPALTLSDLHVDTVDAAVAATVIRHLHYLHSPRRDSLHLGSFTAERRLVALVSLSALDLDTLTAALPLDIHVEQTLVASRVFAFDWAPRNTISHLLANVERRLREARPEVRLLLTYVNPNLGFDGASYRAANWSLFARELGTRYSYLDDDYLTDRQIASLPEAEQARVVYSVMPLAPLRIFARLLRRRDRRVQIVARVLPRP